MKPERLDELVDHWTLLNDEKPLVGNKSGATRLGFVLLLKFFTLRGRFPRGRAELADDVVAFVAKQVKVEQSDLAFYEWSGRTVEYHRAQIRKHLGFRECSVADAEKVTAWLAEEVCQAERNPEQVRIEFLETCRSEGIEPPAEGRVERIVRSALHTAEEVLCVRIASRLGPEVAERIEALIAEGGDDLEDEPGSVLGLIKSVPGSVSLESMLTEIDKLDAVRAIGLPDGLLGDVAPKVVSGWRVRAAVESPSHLRRHPRSLRLALLTALLHARYREITDALVELLIATVHRIAARADRKVTSELVNAFKKVTGKENILFAIAEAAVDHPDETVRASVFPAVTGGEATLRDLVHEYKTKGPEYRRIVQHTLKASYSNHYRRGLIRLLGALNFHSNNTVHRPVLDALALVARYAGRTGITYYPVDEFVPQHKSLSGDWEHLVFKTEKQGRRRVVRAAYEIRTFQALRDALRCKEIWVSGADKWRNPDEDLPADFEARRAENYAKLRKPLDPAAFILTPLDAAPEPANLRRLKAEIARRWGSVPLIDMLIVNAYGTNTGIHSIAGGDHGHSEDELRYVRRRYLSPETARQIAIAIADATFATREQSIWGHGSSAVASDSTHFGAFDQNIFTEWHARYGGRGVLIYWHVEEKSMAIHSQLLTCSASEVAAMIEGTMRHGTSMQVEGNYVDSHGQSEIGFGITRLLGFDLLPRIKRINKVRLYRPATGAGYSNLNAAMVNRAIKWDLIASQYDQMVKYATAIRSGTASTEAILRRFHSAATMHPVYEAMLEVGRAQKTTFVARYLCDRDLQRQVNAGLNVTESWNQGNGVIFYGKGGDIATNRRDEAELSVLCLRILQSALVYVNTLMIQDVLAEPDWADRFTATDRRGLTPLFWSHVVPYGEVRLDMGRRLALTHSTP